MKIGPFAGPRAPPPAGEIFRRPAKVLAGRRISRRPARIPSGQRNSRRPAKGCFGGQARTRSRRRRRRRHRGVNRGINRGVNRGVYRGVNRGYTRRCRPRFARGEANRVRRPGAVYTVMNGSGRRCKIALMAATSLLGRRCKTTAPLFYQARAAGRLRIPARAAARVSVRGRSAPD